LQLWVISVIYDRVFSPFLLFLKEHPSAVQFYTSAPILVEQLRRFANDPSLVFEGWQELWSSDHSETGIEADDIDDDAGDADDADADNDAATDGTDVMEGDADDEVAQAPFNLRVCPQDVVLEDDVIRSYQSAALNSILEIFERYIQSDRFEGFSQEELHQLRAAPSTSNAIESTCSIIGSRTAFAPSASARYLTVAAQLYHVTFEELEAILRKYPEIFDVIVPFERAYAAEGRSRVRDEHREADLRESQAIAAAQAETAAAALLQLDTAAKLAAVPWKPLPSAKSWSCLNAATNTVFMPISQWSLML
jgi:hypothetical protein